MSAVSGPSSARRSYEERGFLVVRGLLSAPVLERAAVEAAALWSQRERVSTRNLRCRFRQNQRTSACELETYDPIIDLSPAAREIAHDAALLAALEDLYGEPACLFKDKLIYKPPGCPGYGLHQDFIAWPGFPRSFLTVLAPLDGATEDNGCTVVYPGQHLDGALSPEDGEYHELPAGTVDEAQAVPLVMQPGDVALFGGFMPHRSAVNGSQGFRRQLYLSYNRCSEGGDQRAAHYQDFHRYLRRRYAEHGKTDLYFE